MRQDGYEVRLTALWGMVMVSRVRDAFKERSLSYGND